MRVTLTVVWKTWYTSDTSYILQTSVTYQHLVPTKGFLRYAGLCIYDSHQTNLLNMEKRLENLKNIYWKFTFLFLSCPRMYFLYHFPRTPKDEFGLALRVIRCAGRWSLEVRNAAVSFWRSNMKFQTIFHILKVVFVVWKRKFTTDCFEISRLHVVNSRTVSNGNSHAEGWMSSEDCI